MNYLDCTTEVLPAVTDHMARIAESLAHQTLQIDVHPRKWNIIIHGIEGPAGELEHTTRAKCIQFAQEVIKVEDAATWAPFYYHGLTLIPAWISNYMPSKVWDEITYPFLNFNGCTVEV